ncbi:MAG: aminopeptidase, partial [Woeseiaceae bacterium]|nr:aminopeptidase [Woeseiaceae bacterium]
GRFDDPVLNTMLRWPDVNLVGTLFHELAHQRLFIRDDTAFNESFASAVAEIGLERWARAHPETIDLGEHRRRERLRQDMMALAAAARADLEAIYTAEVDDAARRELKQGRLQRLSTDAEVLSRSRGFPDAGWFKPPLNNARLLSVILYSDHLPAFLQLFENCREQFDCFYAEAERIGDMDADARAAALEALASRPPPTAPSAAD